MWLRDLIVKDFWLKLLSVAVAVLIWVTVSIAIRQELDISAVTTNSANGRTFSHLPVLVVSSAADVHEFEVQPSHVEVEVRGSPNVLSMLTDKDVRVTVDLTDVGPAQNVRKRVEVATPPGVMFVRVFPAEVEVSVPPKP